VLFLLRLERRASHAVSMALWIPTLWTMMIASRPLGHWFGVTGDNDSGSMLDRSVLACLAVTAIVVVARRRLNWAHLLLRQKWLLALLLYMLASTLWSDITMIAVRRWVRELIVLPMALLILSEFDPRQALATVIRRSAYVLLPFSLVLIKYYPTLGREYGRWSGIEMWTGVTFQKNQLGRLCMLAIFFLGWALYQHWRERPRSRRRYPVWADVFIVFLALYLLKGSDSATSMATLVLGVAGYLVLHLFRRLKLVVPQVGLVALVIFVMAVGTATPFLGGTNVARFTRTLGRDSTLTGRTDVWAGVLPAREQQPLLGYGFGSFWTDARRQFYDIPTAHNGYLDILLQLGEVGLVFYAVWLLSLTRQLHRALPQDFEWASLAICLLLMGLVYNISESALNSFTEHMTAMMTLASFVALRRTKSRSMSVREAATYVGARADWARAREVAGTAAEQHWSGHMPIRSKGLRSPAVGFVGRSAATQLDPEDLLHRGRSLL
jgi:O-antigen ligase